MKKWNWEKYLWEDENLWSPVLGVRGTVLKPVHIDDNNDNDDDNDDDDDDDDNDDDADYDDDEDDDGK